MNISLQDVKITSIGAVLRRFNIDEWLFYAKLSGDHHATAFVLRRIIIWSGTPTVQQRNGWFWKTHDEMSRETGLSEYQIRQAQKRLSKIVQVKVRKHNGKSRTWYRIKEHSLIRAIMTTISRITGKFFSRQTEKTAPTLHERFNADTSKNLSRHTLTSYSNSSDSDNQTQTSINQDANETATTTPPDQPIDDDDLIKSFPELKNYSFTGDCDTAAFKAQMNRVGKKQAIATIKHCIGKGGKSWQYMLTALINLPDQQSIPQPAFIGTQRDLDDTGQWQPVATSNAWYADFIER